jgi:hypothetical protein
LTKTMLRLMRELLRRRSCFTSQKSVNRILSRSRTIGAALQLQMGSTMILQPSAEQPKWQKIAVGRRSQVYRWCVAVDIDLEWTQKLMPLPNSRLPHSLSDFLELIIIK